MERIAITMRVVSVDVPPSPHLIDCNNVKICLVVKSSEPNYLAFEDSNDTFTTCLMAQLANTFCLTATSSSNCISSSPIMLAWLEIHRKQTNDRHRLRYCEIFTLLGREARSMPSTKDRDTSNVPMIYMCAKGKCGMLSQQST